MAKPKRKKITGIIISIAVIAIIGTAYYLYKKANTQQTGPVTYTVVKETFENVIEVSGTVAAAKSQTLQVAGAGTVEAVYVEEGDLITKDTVILQLNNAEQEYNLAQLDYNIEQKLINGSAKEVELLQKQRDMLLDDLKDRQVIAFFDGIVAQLDVSEGDVFESADEIGTLINRDYLISAIEVVETDTPLLAIGQKVIMTFPAYEAGDIEGTVVSWPSVARLATSGASIVDVKVEIENPPPGILPYFSFIGKIEISPEETLLLVERLAIATENRQQFAEVLQPDGSVIRKNVTAVPYDTSYVSILDGLEEGDVLIAQETLVSGTASARQRAELLNVETPSAPPQGGGPGGGR
ncbi:MAG: efflux RND transporter periplasmic adaptor subunit [Spirochaetales bacterium]